MEETITKLAEIVSIVLQKRNLMLATAESCTGGGLSFSITAVPGSTHWFDRGFVTYSNQAKVDMLGVDPDLLKTFGAVSEETAREMALGALEKSKADISIAITGLAGPEYGDTPKPIGTVYIAFAHKNSDLKIQHFQFTGNREKIREECVRNALKSCIEWVKEK